MVCVCVCVCVRTKVVAMGLYFGHGVYLQSSWNILDGLLVFVSLVDILVSIASASGNRILGILRVLRLLRTLRPLRLEHFSSVTSINIIWRTHVA